jgi:hypothetical protein
MAYLPLGIGYIAKGAVMPYVPLGIGFIAKGAVIWLMCL